MDWSQHPWITGIGGSVIAAPIIWAVTRWRRKPLPPTQEAIIKSTTGGTNVALAGSGNTLHVHSPNETAVEAYHARKTEQERQLTLVCALLANVNRTNEYLRGVIAGNENWFQAVVPLHQKIKENRNEFLGLRPQLAALHRPQEVAGIDKWYDDLLALEEYMATETQVVINRATYGAGANAPPDVFAFPAVKEVIKYKVALNAGGSHSWTCGELKKKLEAELRN